MDELDETVLSVTQRQKRAQIMRRYKAKIERSRELAKKRIAPEKNIKKRAYAQARQIVRRRVAGKRGAEYEKLGPSEKIAIDRALEGKQKLIKKIALRLIPRVKQAEQQRLHTFMKGKALQNHGKAEGGSGQSSVQEELNYFFAEQFPPMAERSERKQPKETTDTVARKKGGKEAKGNSNIIQYGKFEEERDCNSSAYKAIAKKARKSGISEDILGEVYNRGIDAWYEETGVSQQQYAFARVNSFINQGKTYFNEDSDLHEGTMKPYVKPHYGNPNKPDQQTGWKSANKHGKTKYWQMFAKNSAEKHAGVEKINEEREVELHDGGPSRNIKKATFIGNHKTQKDHVIIRTHDYLGKPKDLVIHKDWIKEEVSHTNENFIDGKGPGKPGDSARHGLKGKSASELRKIRSSEHASPRKKQLAHWMLNMHHNEETELDEAGSKYNIPMARVKPKKAPTRTFGSVLDEVDVPAKHLDRARSVWNRTKDVEAVKKFVSSVKEETELDEKRGLWDNIHAKRKRIKAGSGERMRKPGSEGAPTKQNFRDASESIEEGYDINSKHYKALTDIELNTKNRDMTTKNDGYGPLNPLDEKGSKKFWDEKAKMWNTTVEAAKEARCGNCAFFNQSPPVMKKIADGIGERGETVSDLAGFGFCELWEFKCAALRTCNTWVLGGPIKEETENGTQLVDKESKNSKLRRRIEKVDRSPPHTEHGKQQSIQKKIIDEEGNSQPDPKKRLVGTKELVKAYKKDTPGQTLDESFNIAFASGVGVTLTARDLGMHAQGGFALHPSVIKEMEEREQEEVEEEVRSADVKGEVVPAHTVTRTNPDGSIKQVTVPGHVRRGKANRKIIGSGSLTDGKPG
jgi:hypothetical protein